MAGDLELCAAAFFRTIGKDVATIDEFIMEVSLGQKWMAPSEAKVLLESLTKAGVVEIRDGYVRPKADILSLDIPLAYRPPKDILQSKPTGSADKTTHAEDSGTSTDVFPMLMNVAVDSGLQRREFIQECNRIQKRLDIDIGAAALIVLRDAGIDITPYSDRVYDWVRSSGITPS